jgi:hypothetical protein
LLPRRIPQACPSTLSLRHRWRTPALHAPFSMCVQLNRACLGIVPLDPQPPRAPPNLPHCPPTPTSWVPQNRAPKFRIPLYIPAVSPYYSGIPRAAAEARGNSENERE